MSKFYPIQNIDKNAIIVSNCLNDTEKIIESLNSKVWDEHYRQNGLLFGHRTYINHKEPEYLEIHEAMTGAADIFLSATKRNLSDYEYNNSCYYVFKWITPMLAMDHHIDRWEADGQPVIPDVSLVMYLTDDFEGGDLIFKEYNTTVKPKAGDIAIFNSDVFHGVSEVLGGRRMTIQLFLFKK